MNRRKFTIAMGTATAGLLTGARLFGKDDDKGDKKDKPKAAKHTCKGKNDCKGQGGCKGSDNGCAGKNSCKGKGGCNPAHLDKKDKDKNSCKGKDGCKS